MSLRVERRGGAAANADADGDGNGNGNGKGAARNGAARCAVTVERAVQAHAAGIVARVSAERGVPAALLEGYLETLAAAAATGRQPRREALDRRRALGLLAAEREIPLSALVDAHLRVTELAWEALARPADAASSARLRAVGGSVLAAAGRLVMAVSEGYEAADRLAVRREEAARRAFVDDLLSGHADLGHLAAQAERFGMRLAGSHVVAVGRAAAPLTGADPLIHWVEDALLTRFGSRNVVVTAKDGLLVCVAPGSVPEAAKEFARRVQTASPPSGPPLRAWQVGIGRAHPGPGGIVRSYDEARGALDLADRLRLHAPVLEASRLLVFPVLLRDREAITDLVHSVLGPLQAARGGPEGLLDTLDAFFACRGNATAAARRLGVSVRTVSYRLERIRQLTGHSPDDPTQRFALQTATFGARLLNWPAQPLDPAP